MVDKARFLMAEAVMVLPPDMRGQQIIQRSDGTAPGNIAAGSPPLGVLVKHGIDNVNECLEAGEKAVAASKQIAFEPTLAHMLAKHFHYAAVRRNVLIGGQDSCGRNAAGDFEHRVQPVRG